MNKIKFHNIVISNFLSIGNANFNLEEQGFVLVNGKNNEAEITQSNGSGKSSLFDSILWTITGETTRGTSDVVNDRSSEGALCELNFSCDNLNYKIIRTRNHSEKGNTLLFYCEDELLSDQLKKSQELIYKTIPVANSQILGSIVLLGQGLPYKFTGLSPAKRKDLLELMSGSSSQIELLKDKLTNRENKIQNKLTENRLSSSTLLGEISILSSQLNQLKEESNQDSNKLERLLVEKKSELKGLSTILDDNNQRLESSQKRFSDLNNLKTQVVSLLSTKSIELNNYENQLNNFKSGLCPTCGKPFEITPESEQEKSNILKNISDLNDIIKVLNSKLDICNSALEECNSNYLLLKSNNTNLNNTILEVNSEITKLENQIKNSNELFDKINNLEKDIENRQIKNQSNLDEISKLEKSLSIVSYLKRELSRDFKGYILKDIIDFVSNKASYYGDKLFLDNSKVKVILDGNKVEVKLNNRSYENLSGGERQRVDLSVQFALRDMLSNTTGFSCNILTLDEAFDNLDSQGSNMLVDLLISEFSDIESIFIVTHHSEMNIPNDKQITVIKNKDGISELEESM